MAPYQIILDTNVFVAGLRSQLGAAYTLLTVLDDSRWQVNLSTTLLFEYEEILKRERFHVGLSEHDIDDLLDGLCSIANYRDIYYVWRPAAHDPDDEFLIDLAVAAQCDFLVTYNTKDVQRVTQFGVRLVTPKEFLQYMGVISP